MWQPLRQPSWVLKRFLIEGGAIGGSTNEGAFHQDTAQKRQGLSRHFTFGKVRNRIGGQAEIRIDWSAMLQRKDNVVSQLTWRENLLRQNGVDVIKGFGEVLDKNTILVNGEKVSFENLIIATGSSPTILPIPGLAEALEMGLAVTSTGALELEEIPDEVVIVGGGVVGMEFAALFNALGSKVTVLEKFTVLGSLYSELQRYMLRLLQRNGVEIYNQADVKRFEGSTVVAEIKGETRVCR